MAGLRVGRVILDRSVRANLTLHMVMIIGFAWFGSMTFTAYEVGAIRGLGSNSLFISWLYAVLRV
ncbi:MAG: DUF417 family protein [Nitrococcus mobilis]|nr:DUF417 family protein [Nitrococcus mobilis]